MKIRVIQQIKHKADTYLPGDFLELDEKSAQKFVDAEQAIVWEEDEKPKRKTVKEVSDGDG